MSIERESSCRVIASRSASSTITNSPFATSQPLTISSAPTSRSCVGHHRLLRIGVLHSRWSVRKLTSDCRAFGAVARASPTGMLTRPKLMDPFQIVRMPPSKSRGTRWFLGLWPHPSTLRFQPVAIQAEAAPEARLAAPRTIARLWQDARARRWEGPAYLVEESGEWRPVSWDDAAQAVDELAHGLLALGIRKGDAFAILASTRLEWALFDFALGLIGAIGAPIYMNSSPKDVAYVVRHSDAVGILCEDEEQRAKLGDAAPQHILTFADLDELRHRGREHAQRHPSAVDEAALAIDPEDLFTYIYTSGTTGPPKACMIRHRNYYAMADCVRQIDDFIGGEDVMLMYLPLAHNFGRLMHLLGPHLGFTLAFCPDPYAVAEALEGVRPTVFPSVPRVYEKMHTALAAKFDETTGAKRRLIDWALGIGRQV